MASQRQRGEEIRSFIVQAVRRHPRDIANVTAAEFDISRQAVHRHLRRLVDEGVLQSSGATRSRVYSLRPLSEWSRSYDLSAGLAEDRVWSSDIAPHLAHLAENARRIWQYGFTEMFNNIIDHCEGTSASVKFATNALATEISLYDNGVGIFNKIKNALRLDDERHAALELAKGKTTTDPARHTGEGVFFASRMFDEFLITSGRICFSHHHDEDEDWFLDTDTPGTIVSMSLDNETNRTAKEVFDRFSSPDDYRFNRTVVPVQLAKHGDEFLVSRSQAKRLLSGLDRFDIVVFDFTGVQEIGQAFADEVFRVFANHHPAIRLEPINACPPVQQMIARAQGR